MNTDLTFITNEPDASLLNRFKVLIKPAGLVIKVFNTRSSILNFNIAKPLYPFSSYFGTIGKLNELYFCRRIRRSGKTDTEIIIDRADRRLLDNSFKNFDKYLLTRVNTKTISRVKFVTHANSEYVFLMQMSDLICGAVKDSLNSKNNGLKSVVNRQLLRKIW